MHKTRRRAMDSISPLVEPQLDVDLAAIRAVGRGPRVGNPV